MAVSRRFVVCELRDRQIYPGNSKYCSEVLKFINETFGLPKESEVLKKVANYIGNSVRYFMNLAGPTRSKPTIPLPRVLGGESHKDWFDKLVYPPSPPTPKPNRPGAPRKTFMSKGYSGQNLEANKIKKRESSHDFRAMIKASALAAKEQGFTDAWSVLCALADDITVAKKLKAVLVSKCPGTFTITLSFIKEATTKLDFIFFVYLQMTQC